MFRNLSAIEIAEGALLADIAVAFQFLATFLPVAAHFFSLLNFTVFTILVLRRGTYVGIMGMCVSVFLLCVLIGPHGLILMVTEGLGGLFLGFMMKHRFHHLPLLLLGIVGGTIYTYVGLLALAWLSGIPWQVTLESLHRSYQASLVIIASLTHRVGLGVFWQRDILPPLNSFVNLAFAYWWVALFIGLLIFFCPAVTAIYVISNSLVRLLGYDVRPLASGKLRRQIRGWRWRKLRRRVKRMKRRKQWSRV
ncbi:DUF2232 domain-containing protein [Dictyobacter arantiisoli]|uniref:DUF2232 domain-containing protein n=1 Tax=Dictyobacter arantiisoli TaxID=2014874 RepID=A0A5A5TKT0_9CHLR|nr:DUF2232 domain-containing protein [Dictyobacter arantiisoli]GCF11679.1 hypothetical protein KDI_52430 [Dictyobacter arantiisoli]